MIRKLSKDASIHVTDERFNTISHIVGAIFSLVGVSLLVVKSSILGKPWNIVSFSIYGASLILMFIASSLHHGIDSTKKIEKLFRQLDYFAIFPLIGGTYTPICLILLRDWLGWTIFGVVWLLCAFGITIKALFPKIPKWFTNTLYISLGWIGCILAIPLINIISYIGIIFLTAGGIFYSVGFFIFYIEKPNPFPGKFGFHEIWHVFVILGALCHFLMMYFVLLHK